MTAPPASGRLSSRFSLRSSAKTSRSLRSWFSSSPKPNGGDDVAEDAAAAARELDATKPRAESSSSYVPRVEYGPPRCDVQERDASWTSNEQVEAHYAALGWAVVPICKDGNCLFRAVSDQLYTNELFHQDIRRRLVDFIESDEKLFKPFIEDEDVADYCVRLHEDDQWGGHLELYAAAKLFNIHIVVHTGPVRRLRVTNEDDGDAEKQQPPYRTLHLLFKDDHYSSLHSNKEVTTVTPEEDAVVSSDKRPRSPTKVYDSPDKKSGKYQVALTKAVKFQEVVEAKSPQREGHTCIYAEENVPECGVFLPKQVLFRRGKRRVSGATLFSLVHVPSTSNLLPVMESPSTSESSSSSTASTTSETSSSSEEQEERSDTKPPVPPRPKATAPTLRAVPVEYPSKAVFRKGRTTAAAC
ncbi:hypothetical protein PF005_g11581 [Phytophthora fragariae]|uniref:OTU domain-containing protein 1 n=1 Tax=Phytophthora fragariae TaxID=53985 RepID=A0A6A3XXD8_9STRA|nr:hypothetical protein PF003_g8064 [Phytophthora fragariae]KAE8937235.1 hypothetical protein PF009_g12859 [Phytophthora fragariae]KAE9009117.1 hypothetical protein PF011_g10429 [Phytophthora fragariae]KAE9110582.1 hypothetical protein PF007_g11821 [Phytophthora fragariae]KAE9114960.1 hypothetical protein PF010_g9533 [Phytophthora fragariae]